MLARMIGALLVLSCLLSGQADAQVNDVLAQRLGADPNYLVLNIPTRPGAWPGAIFTDDLRIPIVRGREDDPELKRGPPMSIEATDFISFGAGAGANVKSWFSFAAKASETGKVLISFPDIRVVDLTFDELKKRIRASQSVLDAMKRGIYPLVVIRAYEGTPTIKISKEAAASAEASAKLSAAATEANVQAGVSSGDYVVYRAGERVVFAFETMKAFASANSGTEVAWELQKGPASVFLADNQMPSNVQLAAVRVRGTIEKVDGSVLTVKTRDGSTTQIKLTDNARVTAMVKASLADIKQGNFIGVTAMPQPDGSQKAIGLHIFMDAQRGVVPARFSPWDREPGSTMTNADVVSTVAGVDGQTVIVKYPDGEKRVIVPPNTPVVKFEPGSFADLKPGAQFIIIAAQKAPDGSLTAPAINVGRDGAAPPM